MTFVVPFDGSSEANAALARASEVGTAMGETVFAIAVIPTGNSDYARKKGWLNVGESFDLDTIVENLVATVEDIAPEATFEYEQTSRSVSGNSIAKPIRKFAKRHDASMVFIGSDNAGRLTTSLSSIGDRISTDMAYDVVIVRQRP